MLRACPRSWFVTRANLDAKSQIALLHKLSGFASVSAVIEVDSEIRAHKNQHRSISFQLTAPGDSEPEQVQSGPKTSASERILTTILDSRSTISNLKSWGPIALSKQTHLSCQNVTSLANHSCDSIILFQQAAS